MGFFKGQLPFLGQPLLINIDDIEIVKITCSSYYHLIDLT